MLQSLPSRPKLYVKQVFELAELVGFETRNKYRITDEAGRDIGFAAEQQKGLLGLLMRQFLGHWRSFHLHFFDHNRQPVMVAEHPFRWFFQRLEVREAGGRALGMVEREFGILTKKFNVQDAQGRILLRVSSPLWRFWTFPFMAGERERARVSKKWTGLGAEMFTDKDNFLVDFMDTTLNQDERALVLAAAVYIDMLYFERKGSGGGFQILGD
ncbi:MAG TPA: phospholipid scramblase-related protein [Bdellovibrionota bacterium]|jgi:uncharacterized protein YxjI